MAMRQTGRTFWLTIGLAALFGGGAAANVRTVSQPAPVGGPPTLDYDRCPNYLEDAPCSEPIVIGGRRVFNGPVELVGYDSRSGTCVDADHPAADVGAGFCGFPLHPEHGAAIDLAGWIYFSPGPRPDFTDLLGTVSDATARVGVRYRRNGEDRARNAPITAVDDELAARIGADGPFRAFVATLRGCIQIRKVRLTAFDASGAVLGSERHQRSSSCRFRAAQNGELG